MEARFWTPYMVLVDFCSRLLRCLSPMVGDSESFQRKNVANMSVDLSHRFADWLWTIVLL